jgi:hypothetical protein
MFNPVNPDEAAEWRQRMTPVPGRIPLADVAKWRIDMWEWRTAEWKAGRGNMYDGHPSYRASFTLVTTKYPWFDVNDRFDISPFILDEMKKRAKGNPEMKAWLKGVLKEMSARELDYYGL